MTEPSERGRAVAKELLSYGRLSETQLAAAFDAFVAGAEDREGLRERFARVFDEHPNPEVLPDDALLTSLVNAVYALQPKVIAEIWDGTRACVRMNGTRVATFATSEEASQAAAAIQAEYRAALAAAARPPSPEEG